MNTRHSLTLLGLALGILLALLIAPQTRWLVRAQLPPLLPAHYAQKERLFIQQHSTDFPIQLAGKPNDPSSASLTYARSLVPRFPKSASLRAFILRDATRSEVHMNRDENYLVNNQPVPPYQADPQNPPPTPAHLAEFDADAAAGERIDPDNAFFPFMRAIGLFAAHRDAEGLAAVQRASTKPVWREYTEDEVEGRWRIIDAVYGEREAVSASAVSASVLFPHYTELRAAARVVAYKAILDEQAGHLEAGLAKREALGRCGELMSVQSTTFIGNLVGVEITAISRSRPGGIPPLESIPSLSGDQRVQKRLELYCAYVVKIGHPEAASEARADYQTWQQVHRIGAKVRDYAMGVTTTDFFHLAIGLFTGAAMLPNILILLLLGLAAAGLCRMPQIEAQRSLPAGATFGFWSIVVIVLLLGAMFVSDAGGSFELFAALLILTPLAFAALVILFVLSLRRSATTALLSAGVTLGAIGLFTALALWQMQGISDIVASIRQFAFVLADDKTALMQTLLLGALGLAIPLLTAIVLSIRSRIKRVPVSVGLIFGFRAVMPPLVCGLMVVYGGLTLWMVQQEARANYGLERSLHGEGQYLAQLTGLAWPQRQAGFFRSSAEPAAIMPETDLSRFFTNTDRSVYALRNLPEEVVAYLFARYSRSRLSLRDDLRSMMDAEDLGALIGPGQTDSAVDGISALQERARAFAEKYVLGYGHSSVAEHGVVHLALEDVSIIASKLIEDARLASYTEKSTRYVAFDPDKAYYPPRVMADRKLGDAYAGAVRGLLEAYTGWTEDFVAQIKARTPRGEKQTERAYEAASRATAFDLLRYLLPAATHTNVGLTLNARTLEHLITKLLSQPLEEGRGLGTQIKVEAQHVVPTLLKYADYNPYRAETSDAIEKLAGELLGSPPAPNDGGARDDASFPTDFPIIGGGGVSLVFSDPDADNRLVAAILYGASLLPMETLLAQVKTLSQADKERVIDEYLKRRGKHDAPGRALERVFCTVEMTMDYGAFRDVQRHRMATQTTQALSPALGFERPEEFETFGYAAQYENLMAQSADAYGRLCEAGFVHEAAYVLPLATRIRALFTWNLREVTHFVELRSARQGHPSYRKIAQEVYHAIEAAFPLVARYMRPDLSFYALTRD